MSDLFHPKVPDEFVGQVFKVMMQANQHIFQILTKRSERMMIWCRSDFSKNIHHSPHIWLGVSVENQKYVWRIRHLQRTPAKIRFLSIEPMLGPVKLEKSLLYGIDWVIVGGESGPKARPMKSDWVRDVRDMCQKYKIPFF
jgi:protein gp37